MQVIVSPNTFNTQTGRGLMCCGYHLHLVTCIFIWLICLFQHSCIYVRRSGKFVQEKTERQLDELKQNNIPVSTIFTPK